jgi:formylglycine-generating enzyme required for sulfatase activity
VRKRRLIIACVVLFFLAGILSFVWVALDWPPVRFVLKYGLTPGCAPTGQTLTVEGVEFVQIGPGIARIGSTYWAGGDWLGKVCLRLGLPWGDQPTLTEEMPVHWVEFENGFRIARTEITNEQYERFDPQHERHEYSEGDNHPVVNVYWDDARRYCEWLSEKSGLPVRLPSEAEWECACRAGTETEYWSGDEEADLARVGWHDANSDFTTHPVAEKPANPFGLFDMHGNVWEWCEDTLHENYEGAPDDGSARVEGGTPYRVLRGGGWTSFPVGCRLASRYGMEPSDRDDDFGFRPAISVRPDD